MLYQLKYGLRPLKDDPLPANDYTLRSTHYLLLAKAQPVQSQFAGNLLCTLYLIPCTYDVIQNF